jgi:hypothetical protein
MSVREEPDARCPVFLTSLLEGEIKVGRDTIGRAPIQYGGYPNPRNPSDDPVPAQRIDKLARRHHESEDIQRV